MSEQDPWKEARSLIKSATPPQNEAGYKLTKNRLMAASLYTLGFFTIPILIYANQRLFKRFCDFHVRLLKLDKKGPGGLAASAALMSIVYSGVTIPIYYSGLLKIMGLKSLGDLRGCMTDSIVNRFQLDQESEPGDVEKNRAELLGFDQRVVVALDKSIGIPEEMTEQVLRSSNKSSKE